jgi:8-oxo-dGTP pyrophosphatase MutT (NUDIX family)
MRFSLHSVARLKYRLSYWMLRAWWFARQPATHSTGVALWHKGRILLVRTSYRSALSLPGGFVKRSESSDDAARRLLLEQLGDGLAAGELWLVWQGTLSFESRLDTTDIWEMCVQSPPWTSFDSRRIVWAGWMVPSEALQKRLLLPVRLYLLEKNQWMGRQVSAVQRIVP